LDVVVSHVYLGGELMEIITKKEARAKGLNFYFTGKPCKNGHVSPRYVNGSGNCLECNRVKDFPESREKQRKEYIAKLEAETGKKIMTRQEAERAGLRFYFNGKPCPNGHLAERMLPYGHCVTCHTEGCKSWRQNNREKVLQSHYEYYHERGGRERHREWRKKCFEENPNLHREHYQRYHVDIPEEKKEHRRERHRQRMRQRWAEDIEHREQRKLEAQLRRRYLKKTTPKWIDPNVFASFYKEAAEKARQTGVKHHVDHYYPRNGETVSGLHVPWNLQVIPAAENTAKHNKMPEEFYGANHTPPTWGAS